eukprot:TRINITY_DN2943_c0_g1_i1.p1 TRINITY_DN2943_c0_g1~~TRINITY_DN2943_c0_g1_i1.p1  ORF type:complete len:855 (+),score=133.84 TRINITY_DN2943_c0_g1_i1:76-2640(+)
MNAFQRCGRGVVPAMDSLVQDALKVFVEGVVEAPVHHSKMTHRLDFTKEGLSVQQVRDFFTELLSLDGADGPIVQSGGTYGVSDSFHKINAALILHQVKTGPISYCLSEADRARASEIFQIAFGETKLRNRNPLHPGVVDACAISNLVDFPKLIFGLPFACFATDGNESLSLALFSYREEQKKANPAVLFVVDAGSSCPPDIRACVERLGMELIVEPVEALSVFRQSARVVATITDFASASLDVVATWAAKQTGGLHIHVSDLQLRRIFSDNEDPVHFILPPGVRSLTLEEGFLHAGYVLYRDHALRDYHMDVPLCWQTMYVSPNEGGSASARPLLMDLCTFVLGWSALGALAKGMPPSDHDSYQWLPLKLANRRPPDVVAIPYEEVLEWSMQKINSWAELERKRDALAEQCRQSLEMDFINFQQLFMGGYGRNDLEGFTTGGGTRSINAAFEAVIWRHVEKNGRRPLRVITGNPHLAVERATRRFGFDLLRVEKAGTISVELLQEAIGDPCVGAVYAQTLSYTDGISDPLLDILKIVEAENKRRADQSDGPPPVVIINDSCLAFSILIHHRDLRLLDLSKDMITPVIVMNDAHKHMGTDKGISTIIGTSNIMTWLNGRARVGARPQVPGLVSALANVRLMGNDGYQKLYTDFSVAVEGFVKKLEDKGMKVIHKENRLKGSTVIAVEDPSGAVSQKLKKKGYSTNSIYNVRPEEPSLCQTGWQLSLTPHHLRRLKNGKTALESFGDDLVSAQQSVQGNKVIRFTSSWLRENSLIAFTISGNTNPYVFQLLQKEGIWRNMASTLIRRMWSAQLDNGVICSKRRRDPIGALARRTGLQAMFLIVILACLRLLRRRR